MTDVGSSEAAAAATPVSFLDLPAADELPATDDILSMVLPVFDQVAAAHARGQVAPLDRFTALHLTREVLWFENGTCRAPRHAPRELSGVEQHESAALDVVAFRKQVAPTEGVRGSVEDLSIHQGDQPPERPVFVVGYSSWELLIGHHDPLTDIFQLGILSACVATGLDFRQRTDLETFVRARHDLRALNPRLHPVVARAIWHMTEPERHQRAQDLPSVIETLRCYRDQTIDDLHLGQVDPEARSPRQAICAHLKNRLFDISRRNRLLYFRQTGQTLDLSVASVPHVLDHRNIKPETLFVWANSAVAKIADQKPVSLGRFLRFEDYPYLPGVLDRIRLQAKRAENEYGLSQLRLVVCFLHWHNLKDVEHERISSPLLLLPASLERQKGVRDAYVLRATADTAEVNPVLRHQLKQLYDLDLPEAVNLTRATAVGELYESLSQQIEASEPGVTLRRIDRPQIELISALAKRRLEVYRRRVRSPGRGLKRFGDFDYSYHPDRYHPLGIQLFTSAILPAGAPDREFVDKPRPRILPLGPEPGTREIRKEMYSIRKEGDSGGPYSWAFDLCSLTLANFNYRKMSLVRDYVALVDGAIDENKAFDTLFQTDARPLIRDGTAVPIEAQYPVVPVDPTQTAAICRARTGDSYIIQGPPGTGKSQTIANLIADYAARGKRVLFVCEKRVALDVVYHRLTQLGLGRLCSLIHDSQSDKKAFIQDLKAVYEDWLGSETTEPSPPRHAAAILRDKTDELERRWSALRAPAPGSRLPLGDILRRTIVCSESLRELSPRDEELLPSHLDLDRGLKELRRLTDTLQGLGVASQLHSHPWRLLHQAALQGDEPLRRLTTAIDQARPALERIVATPALHSGDTCYALTVVRERTEFARELRPLLTAGVVRVLDTTSDLYRRFSRHLREISKRTKRLERAKDKLANWRSPLTRQELAPALELARRWHRRLFRFLFPGFWRLRRLIRARYDFSAPALKPAYLPLLADVEARYAAEDALEQQRVELTDELGAEDLEHTIDLIQTVQNDDALTATRRQLRDELLASDSLSLGKELDSRHHDVIAVHDALEDVFDGHQQLAADALLSEMGRLHDSLDLLADIRTDLGAVLDGPPTVTNAARHLALSPDELEAAVYRRTVDQAFREDRSLRRLDADGLSRLEESLQQGHADWYDENVRLILQLCQARFAEHLRITATPAAQLTEDEKLLKKTYSRGRRQLEHEFGKVMRFRSIRDLVSSDPGGVIRDLKPVWLMSPLSVSDTLPIDATAFDVVIFDEASQIPLEDAVPAIHRASQTIVVGDEMQLPPTKFFRARAPDQDEAVEFELDAGEVSYELDADSLLNHAARNLSGTMLQWHYRSREEALIGFCNHAFYAGDLLTIPSTRVLLPMEEITGHRGEDGAGAAESLLERPVSFHRIEGAVYERRRNRLEAQYIAHMLRELLRRESGLTFGVVAFSENQQDEIEAAIRQLCDEDQGFRGRFEDELERHEDDQFVGLFIKNLENVQGDERDVIILSICYGPDAKGAMRMNFGPINKMGGEKRLNVVFSRAKQHMAVVSGVRYTQITNEYNDGASALRRYLQYAAAASRGDRAEMETAVKTFTTAGPRATDTTSHPIVGELRDVLEREGYAVDCNLGSSRFAIDLAARKPHEARFRLGILIDGPESSQASCADEHYRLRPAILRVFGWRVVTVLPQDWLADRQRVVRNVLRVAAG